MFIFLFKIFLRLRLFLAKDKKGGFMTRNNSTNRIKTTLILLLTIICLVCTCAFGLSACDQEDVTLNDPTVSVDTESADVLIKNSTFKIDTANKELKSFPLTSPASWGRFTSDNSAPASAVNSGVINTADDAWKVLLQTLYNDTDFLSYVKKLYDFTDSKVTDAIKAEKGDTNYSPTKDEIKEYAINNYLSNFANPKGSPASTDNYVYMLNNMTKSANFGLGTAQKVTSSSTVSMEKGEVYELSVWVKTVNIEGINEKGANIRLTNNFNGKKQADFKISNIIANDWTKYSIYIKADADYSATFSLVLGLGYGNGSINDARYFTEGTAFFDEISIKKVDNFEGTFPTDNVLMYNSEEAIEAKITNVDAQGTNPAYKAAYYDMTFAHSETSFFNDITTKIKLDDKFTTSNITVDDGNGNQVPLTSANKVGVESTENLTYENNSAVMTVNKASATITVTDNNSADKTTNFTLKNGEYALVSFYIKNELKGPASTNVYIDVFDKYGNDTIKNAAAVTISETNDEYVRKVIAVANNFTDGGDRQFYFDVIVGPNDVASVEYDSDFATGKVSLQKVSIAKGLLEDKPALYDYFFSVADASIALHAGYEADFKEEGSGVSYSFTSQPGNFGDIIFNPTTIKGYTGITANHAFINNKEDSETAINTRINKGTEQGVAGLINTKYLKSNYSNGAEIATKLGVNDNDDAFQAIMINNKTKNDYGFVSEKMTVEASAYGMVSVTLRVCDDAIANVYLVDVSKIEKDVLTFNDFTVNTDVVAGVEKDTLIKGSDLKYQLKVTSDMMNSDGWVTLSFYVGAGNTAKSFRLEVWNGDRTGTTETSSQGYVFVKSIVSSLTSGFTESAKWNQTFTTEGNPLYEHHKASFNKLYAYERPLTADEKAFNKEYPDKAISYATNYVWAESKTAIYGVFNTIDPVIKNPYDDITETEGENSGCTAISDPSSFWLSFSSILLAAVLVLAIIALIVKRIAIRRLANKNDAVSHYKVTSRISKPKKAKIVNKPSTNEIEEVEDVTDETSSEQSEELDEATEENSNEEEYVYGEVESFDDTTSNEEVEKDSSNEQAEDVEIIPEETSNQEENK